MYKGEPGPTWLWSIWNHPSSFWF